MLSNNNNTGICNPAYDGKPSRHRRRSLPPFPGIILEQVLQFVLPEDVARVSMVCTTWRDELKPPLKNNTEAAVPIGVFMNSKAIWKQAVINSSPNVMQAVIAASGGEKEVSATTPIDFLKLAKSGLGRKRKNPELPEPCFQIENLLIVLELKQHKVIKDENGREKNSVKILDTFFHNGNQDMIPQHAVCGKIDFDVTKGPGILLEGQNPLCPDTYDDGDKNNSLLWKNAQTQFRSSLAQAVNRGGHNVGWWSSVKRPIMFASNQVHDQLVASVTLFRRDDWRSFACWRMSQ